MKLNIKEDNNYVYAYKPSGIATHAPSDTSYGFVEYLSRKLSLALKVCHRLDKETSGAIVFAKNLPAAKELAKYFETGSIEKTYLFVSDRAIRRKRFSVEDKNGKTDFSLVKQSRNLSLWQALPKTGKYHQIRIHAANNGIPVLGDREYRGTSFPRLMLHAESIKCNLFSHRAELPSYLKDLKLLNEKQLASWLIAFENRKALFQFRDDEALRIIHNEDKQLNADKYGKITCFYWYGENPPLDNLNRFTKQCDIKNYLVSLMKDRGEDSKGTLVTTKINCPDTWTANENDATFELRSNQGSSPGLFLDQREHRNWVMENAKDKSVLNLFSYSGGFSVMAALGGAKKVISVDTSSAYHDWAKSNFLHNKLNPSDAEFIAKDVRDFLKETKEKFDLIICDPPTFARSKRGVFSIEKEFQSLVENCINLLEASGTLLISTNFEKWSANDLAKRIKNSAVTISINHGDLDFEMPGIAPRLKSLKLIKQS